MKNKFDKLSYKESCEQRINFCCQKLNQKLNLFLFNNQNEKQI